MQPGWQTTSNILLLCISNLHCLLDSRYIKLEQLVSIKTKFNIHLFRTWAIGSPHCHSSLT